MERCLACNSVLSLRALTLYHTSTLCRIQDNKDVFVLLTDFSVCNLCYLVHVSSSKNAFLCVCQWIMIHLSCLFSNLTSFVKLTLCPPNSFGICWLKWNYLPYWLKGNKSLSSLRFHSNSSTWALFWSIKSWKICC